MKRVILSSEPELFMSPILRCDVPKLDLMYAHIRLSAGYVILVLYLHRRHGQAGRRGWVQQWKLLDREL